MTPFLITIDTEGDNLWGDSAVITTRNARFLPRFQSLCEKYQLKPSYLSNFEMATDPAFQEFARDVIARDAGEIGMHLHAWHSPPDYPALDKGGRGRAYLIEYPEHVMRQKIDYLTKLLEDNFNRKMKSHRAGRWAFDEVYARLLIEQGYLVDCSVTPHVDWSATPGDPAGAGGSDYRRAPKVAYFIDGNDILTAGRSSLLEVPMSTELKYSRLGQTLRQFGDRLRQRRRAPAVRWLRPRGGNAAEMIKLAHRAAQNGSGYAEFMLHSSEFMPGGSPTFPDAASIERLYVDLEQLFASLGTGFSGTTLSEFHALFCEERLSGASRGKRLDR